MVQSSLLVTSSRAGANRPLEVGEEGEVQEVGEVGEVQEVGEVGEGRGLNTSVNAKLTPRSFAILTWSNVL